LVSLAAYWRSLHSQYCGIVVLALLHLCARLVVYGRTSCTSTFLVAGECLARELPRRRPRRGRDQGKSPTARQIRFGATGNVCLCVGGIPIVCGRGGTSFGARDIGGASGLSPEHS